MCFKCRTEEGDILFSIFDPRKIIQQKVNHVDKGLIEVRLLLSSISFLFLSTVIFIFNLGKGKKKNERGETKMNGGDQCL